jgi:hypothetical protein
MLVSHNIETQAAIEVYDRNKNLKSIVELPLSKNSVSGEIECTIRNSDGTIDSVQKYPMRSLVKNFFAFLGAAIGSGYPVAVTTTGGATNYSYNILQVKENVATYGQITYGLIIGTGGATAVTPTQYALVTPIAHGTGAGQMEYFPTQLTEVIAESDDYSVYVFRTYANSSPGSITVSELGLYAKTVSASFYYMFARDVVDYTGNPISLTVDVGQVLTVIYKFKVSEASGLTKNFATGLKGLYLSGEKSSYVSYTGTVRNTGAATLNHNMFSANSGLVDDYGLVVGSGTSAIDIDKYCVDSKISAGFTSGTLYYGDTYVSVPITTATYNITKFGRSFTNLTTDDITINEFAWYGYYCMMGRWLTGGITLSEFESSHINISIIGYA